jgi:two-component system nitrogen regulation response regulator GlnG
VPVIVMSAYTDIAEHQRLPSAAARFDFLPKPFDLDAATAMARNAPCRRHRPRRPASDDRSKSDAELLGDSPAMRELFRAIGRLSQRRIERC